jgi:hypothetical protein
MLLRHIGFRRLCVARDLLLEPAEASRPIADVAGELGLSPSHLIRQFEPVFGTTPHQFRIKDKALRFYTDVLGFRKKHHSRLDQNATRHYRDHVGHVREPDSVVSAGVRSGRSSSHPPANRQWKLTSSSLSLSSR